MTSFEFTFIDFDETLFHTEDFKKALLFVVARYGVTPDDFWKTVKATESAGRGATYYDYTYEKHVERLRKIGYDIPKTVLAELSAVLNDQVSEFVFPDAIDFLSDMRIVSGRLVLLSSGNRSFQLPKIWASGLSGSFDEIIVVHDHKETIVDYFTEQGKKSCLFINDNLDENIRVREVLPSVTVISKINTIKFAAEEYRKSGIPTVATLREIKNMLSSS